MSGDGDKTLSTIEKPHMDSRCAAEAAPTLCSRLKNGKCKPENEGCQILYGAGY